jgi:hypothetical protein
LVSFSPVIKSAIRILRISPICPRSELSGTRLSHDHREFGHWIPAPAKGAARKEKAQNNFVLGLSVQRKGGGQTLNADVIIRLLGILEKDNDHEEW